MVVITIVNLIVALVFYHLVGVVWTYYQVKRDESPMEFDVQVDDEASIELGASRAH